ncbi:hypothetical protein LIER_23724 [Lithospermum erythrorhizon]|uniref:Transmembrane protein n=1 Tax=Lithospermum erythrorhizon TaxID=34254 RepID=A0AAV3R1N9_LITER
MGEVVVWTTAEQHWLGPTWWVWWCNTWSGTHVVIGVMYLVVGWSWFFCDAVVQEAEVAAETVVVGSGLVL